MVNLRQQRKLINKKKTNFRYCSQFVCTNHDLEVVSEQRKAGWSFVFLAKQAGHSLRQWNVWNVSECPTSVSKKRSTGSCNRIVGCSQWLQWHSINWYININRPVTQFSFTVVFNSFTVDLLYRAMPCRAVPLPYRTVLNQLLSFMLFFYFCRAVS